MIVLASVGFLTIRLLSAKTQSPMTMMISVIQNSKLATSLLWLLIVMSEAKTRKEIKTTTEVTKFSEYIEVTFAK